MWFLSNFKTLFGIRYGQSGLLISREQKMNLIFSLPAGERKRDFHLGGNENNFYVNVFLFLESSH